jgi:hypothetical protein
MDGSSRQNRLGFFGLLAFIVLLLAVSWALYGG